MIFFRVFPRTRCEQNKLSFEGFNNFASWDIFGEVPLFASFSSSSFGKKTTNSRFQGFKTIRISGQVPDDGSHWDDAFAVSWMTGFTSLLMVDGGIFFTMKKIGSRFSESTFLFQHAFAPYAPASQRLTRNEVFVESKESQDHRISIWRLVKPWTLPRVGVYRAISMTRTARDNGITSYL